MSKVSPVRALLGALLLLSALLAAVAIPSCLSTNGTNLFATLPDASFDAGPGIPVVSVNGATQGFGSISLGASSVPTAIVVTNTGTAATGTLKTALGGANPDSFQIDSDICSGQVLAAGASCTVTLHFAPKTVGSLSATFTISATPGGSLTVQLTGQSAPPGALAISPSTNDFGSIVTGASSSATAFTVTNSGGGATGTLSAALSGTDKGSFTIGSDTCTGSTLAAGASCSVGVTFAPITEGTKAASLSVTGTPGGSASAALGGTAITGGVLSMSPATQDFGSTVVGATSTAQTFTVTNTGGATSGATFSSTFTGTNATEFSVSANTCSAALPPGGNCTFTVVFKPLSAGAKTATFTVGAAPGGTVSSTLTATGLSPAALSVAPASNDFGSVIVGQQSTDVSFTVTNQGQSATGTLTVTETGAGFAIDAAKSDCAAALGPGQSCNVAVYFKPSSATTVAGSLTVQGTPGGKVAPTFTGTGLTPGALSIAPATFTFPNTLLNQTSAAQTFTVSNSGGGATGTLTASITGSGSSQFKVGTDGCSTNALAGKGSPGSSCTVTVQFAPTASGTPSATLLVTASGAGGSTSASMNGTGQAPAKLAWSATSYTAPTAATGTSTTVAIVLTNSGDVASGVPTFAMTGANAGDFSVPAGSCAGGIAAHSQCNLTATFTPKTTTGETATLTASATPGGSTPTTLKGTGAVPASFTISPASFPFGSFVVGTSSPTQQFTITNAGGVPAGSTTALALASTGTDKGDFVLSGSTCPAILNGGGSCLVDVTYKPTITGAESASLSVTATPGGTKTAGLTGTGLTVGALAIDTPSYAFPTSVIGTPTADKVITVSNTGQGSTSALTVSINGGATSPFKIDATNSTCPGAVLAGSATCTVSVFYDASASGTQSDTLTVSATTGGTVTSALSGVGESPAALALVTAQGTQVAFGSAIDGKSTAPVTFTATNSGQEASGAISVNFAGTNSGDFQVATPVPACLAAGIAGGKSCAFSIVFTPSIVGTESASVTVTASPGGTSSPPIGLGGTGQSPGPQLQVSPANKAWGNVLFAPSPQVAGFEWFTVTNIGGAATGAVSAKVSGADFSDSTYPASDGCTGQTLASGAACMIGVSYTSQKPSLTSTGSLSVTEPVGTNDTVTAALSATAVNNGTPLSVTSSGGLGGGCIANDAGLIVSSTVTYTIQNAGTVNATGPLSIAIDPVPVGQFVIVSGTDQCTGTSLAPGGSCTFQLVFQTPKCTTTFTTMDVTDGNGDQLAVSVDASMG